MTYCLIIKNDNYINGFIREPIRHVVINPKNNIDPHDIINSSASYLVIMFAGIFASGFWQE